jgi:hypothetical protein
MMSEAYWWDTPFVLKEGGIKYPEGLTWYDNLNGVKRDQK